MLPGLPFILSALATALTAPLTSPGLVEAETQQGGGATIAAWSADTLYVSRDQGSHFTATLHLSAARFTSGAVDTDGTVFAAARSCSMPNGRQGPCLLKIDPSGGITRTDLAGISVETVSAGGGTVALVMNRDDDENWEMLVSDDAGRTFSSQPDAHPGNAGVGIVVDRLGTIFMMSGSEARCGGGSQFRKVRRRADRKWGDAPWPLDTPVSWGLGAGGLALGIDPDCSTVLSPIGSSPQTLHICTERTGVGQSLHRMSTRDYQSFQVVTNGGQTIAAFGEQLFQVSVGSATPMRPTLPADATLAAVDATSPLAIIGGHLARPSGQGWRSIF